MGAYDPIPKIIFEFLSNEPLGMVGSVQEAGFQGENLLVDVRIRARQPRVMIPQFGDVLFLLGREHLRYPTGLDHVLALLVFPHFQAYSVHRLANSRL